MGRFILDGIWCHHAGNRFPLTTAAHSTTGGYGCSGWLTVVTREAEPVAPPISARTPTVACGQGD